MAKGITRANKAAQDDKEKAEKAAATADQEQQLATQSPTRPTRRS